VVVLFVGVNAEDEDDEADGMWVLILRPMGEGEFCPKVSLVGSEILIGLRVRASTGWKNGGGLLSVALMGGDGSTMTSG
jgi:hypothetical protein